MQYRYHTGRRLGSGLLALAMLFWIVAVRADAPGPVGSRLAASEALPSSAAGTSSDPWRRSIELVGGGDFKGAAQTIRQIHGGGLTDQIRGWLDEYEAKQAARRELDRVEFEKFVGYAKARFAREEYDKALDKAMRAHDVAADRDGFLRSDWLQQLVNDALLHAESLRAKADWRGAWEIYWRLSALYEREPRYQKLEREVVTHLRLDQMFKEGSNWQERLEKVRWEDGEKALENIALYYVEPANFQKMTERGLEQVLLLADSKSAQAALPGLADEFDRNDFKSRLQIMLDQVRAVASMDHDECVKRLRRVVDHVNEQTVTLPEELLVSELLRGALEPLDEFTTMIWPKETEEFEKHTRGDFVGVGIQIVKNNQSDAIEVVTPLDGTPAYRAGIHAGDVITAVDGQSLVGYSLQKVVETITGPKGTPVTLTIRRDGKELEVPLTRELVKIYSVKGLRRDPNDEARWNHWLDRENGIGYVRVTNFQRNTVEDVDNALEELSAEGLKGLVLDLRNNPGGLLDSAWQLSSLFLKKGDAVVSTRGRIPEENQRLNAPADGPFADVPLVVLVDESSASASEIVSGAIRDNNRGTVVGTRTFGKFSVQNLVPLGRSRAKLKITTARYFLPSGVCLHRDLNDPTCDKWGVEPHVPVRLVRWELVNIYQMRRDADLLGPPVAKAKEIDKADGEADPGDEPGVDDELIGPKPEEAGSTPDLTMGPKLPPLEQPDENNRPKEDAQLDTALLMLRVGGLGRSYPTVAAAVEAGRVDKAANP